VLSEGPRGTRFETERNPFTKVVRTRGGSDEGAVISIRRSPQTSRQAGDWENQQTTSSQKDFNRKKKGEDVQTTCQITHNHTDLQTGGFLKMKGKEARVFWRWITRQGDERKTRKALSFKNIA